MSLLTRSGKVVGKSILILAVLSVSGFAAQEHKSESKPAQHESKPSHPAGQSHHAAPSHASHPSHPSGASHAPASHESHASHPSGASHAPASHESHASHPSGASHPSDSHPSGSHPSAPGAGSHPERNAGSHPEGNAGQPGRGESNRGGNPGGEHAGNIPENRGGTANHGERTVSLRGGGSASFRSNGQISSINRNGMQIHNNLHGGRTIVSVHNNVRVVNVGRNGGYVQHAYVTRGGHAYFSRTYYDHGVYRTGVYRGYFYHGFQYYGFHPSFWFHPGFYAWGLHPWGAGIGWGIGFGGWGWAGAPWWGFYGGFFAPYPVYPAPAFWLTDYLISADLQSAYAARAEADAEANAVADDAAASAYGPGSTSNSNASGAPTANAGPVTLSPEVKEAIVEEVKAELAEQQQEAAAEGSGNAQAQPPAAAGGEASAAPASQQEEVPPALNPAQRTFVVDGNITVVSDGQECELTGGDVITRLTDTPDADNKVTASVSGSKKTDCAAGKSVLVSVDDLQEMRNHFEEQLDNGMKELAQKQGTGDMPKAPDTGITESDIPAPQPDTTAAKQLSDQAAAADQTEAQVKQEAAAPAEGQDAKPQ